MLLNRTNLLRSTALTAVLSSFVSTVSTADNIHVEASNGYAIVESQSNSYALKFTSSSRIRDFFTGKSEEFRQDFSKAAFDYKDSLKRYNETYEKAYTEDTLPVPGRFIRGLRFEGSELKARDETLEINGSLLESIML